MKHRFRLLPLLLGLCILASCTRTSPDPTPAPTPEPTPSAAAAEPVRVAMLKGPTGLGAAYLMDNNPVMMDCSEDGEPWGPKYEFTVMAEPTEVVAALTKGEVDIAALPTNLAAVLYHKNEDIRLLCLNTYGVLYILENGFEVNSMADLAGKTLYATGQGANPEYVLNYLLEKSGLTPGEDVDIQWMASDALTAAVAAGEVKLAMLPVPAATSAMLQNEDVRPAVSLSDVWEEVEAEGVLTMGCVVARKAFITANPGAVDAFLEDYGASIRYMSDEDNLTEAAALAEKYGIVPKAAVAEAAIPDANLCFVTGNDMISGIQGYYEVLYTADPSSIGGSIPDGEFYYDYKG